MSERRTIHTTENKAQYVIESDGRIRLIFSDNRNPVFYGYWKPEMGLLYLERGKFNKDRYSFTFSIPEELWTALGPEIKTVGLKVRENGFYYVLRRSEVELYGFLGDNNYPAFRNDGQVYRFVNFQHWTRVGGEEDVVAEAKHRFDNVPRKS